MFSFISNAIELVCNSSRDYIYGDTAFTRNKKWGFTDYIEHIIFNKRKTIRNNIDNHLKYCTSNIGTYRKQSFSEQRINIIPEVFKEINLNYLNNIRYFNFNENNSFFRTFYGYRVFAVDGSRFTLFNKEKTLTDFGFDKDYDRLPKVIFSGVVDVLNDLLIDGIMGARGIGEMTLVHQNIQNCINLIEPNKSIFLFDRGYVSLELICRLKSIKTNFIIRLRKKSYIEERKNINTDDSPINIPLTKNRLNIFKDKKLKEEYHENEELNLRIITIKLKSGETEWLLTNLPSEIMTKEEISEIYNERWGIECTYKTLKQRLQIENYTAYSKIGILQDIYSTFLIYNIFCYSKIYLNKIINRVSRKKDKTTYYEVDQSNLISRIKEDYLEIILNPTKENIRIFTKNFIEKCIHTPNKTKEPRTYNRTKKLAKPKYTAQYKSCF